MGCAVSYIEEEVLIKEITDWVGCDLKEIEEGLAAKLREVFRKVRAMTERSMLLAWRQSQCRFCRGKGTPVDGETGVYLRLPQWTGTTWTHYRMGGSTSGVECGAATTIDNPWYSDVEKDVDKILGVEGE